MQVVKRGLFIVFEGLDRSGKSTQSKMLATYLENELQVPVKSLAFPSKFTRVVWRHSRYYQDRIIVGIVELIRRELISYM